VGATDDIANAAVFLASDASTFITGQDLAVCGGLIPFGTLGWNEAVALRQELSGLVRAELAKGA
jgi:NAD(P)-dependent dehydrogenase (short-subunit alcohol dehydrogenase family)